MMWRCAAIAILGATLLAGCSVQVDGADASVRRATASDKRNSDTADDHPDGKGIWTVVAAKLPRATLEHIVASEVYTHIHIVDCSSNEMTNVSAGPWLGSVQMDDFHAIDAVLRSMPERQDFDLTGLIYARPGDFRKPQCVQFSGGSFLGTKIASKPVGIQVSDPLLREF
jgi:hypothetical protein